MRVTITSPAGEVLREIDDPAVADSDAVAIRRACPACQHHDCAVRGVNTSVTSHGKVADAACLECDAVVGRIRVDIDTIFGVDEDRDFIESFRGRVYGLTRSRFGGGA